MIKKGFAVVAALFLMSMTSSTSVEMTLDNEIETTEFDCLDQVAIIVAQADAAGWTLSELAWLSNAALAVYCYGYSWSDVMNQQ